MSTKYVVMGSMADYGEWEHNEFDDIQEALALAKKWSVYEDMTWVAERISVDRILWSSSTALPRKELLPV